jgi:GH15 family glucan-1,4-alpha-glucosidase
MVLETTWQTGTGWMIIRDALCIGPWYSRDRLPTYRRSPGDFEAEHCLLRTVRCVNGHVELALSCEPVFDYGRTEPTWEYDGPGYDSAVARGGPNDPPLRLATSLRLGFEGRGAHAYSRLQEGDTAFVALCWGDHPPPATFEEAADRMWRTGDYWREWLHRGEFPDHPWRIHLQRSALTLKGLIYVPTGALLAAATTSLPETPGGERNWDYRYSWVRDATFALWGLYTLGFDYEANNFFYFIADVCGEDGDLQPVYGVGEEKELEERVLDHLSGYVGARPVRVGNDAYRQRQHDVWGVFLDSVYLHARSRDHLPERVWPILKRQVENAVANWREPDRGIWEIRGEPRHFTSSKLMCWVACDRGARLARLHEEPELAERWQGVAEEIHADICEHGVDGRGVFVQHYGGTTLDASLLLMPLVRFLPPHDPRIRATVLAIADELTVDGLVLRYRVQETDDGLTGEEGTFTICSFWLVSALAEIGEVERARQLCEKLLSHASPLLLYAEEIDPRTGRHLGNFPQAFTHLALINAVMHIIRAEERMSMRFAPARRGLRG